MPKISPDIVTKEPWTIDNITYGSVDVLDTYIHFLGYPGMQISFVV
jgi:hypothetical protein